MQHDWIPAALDELGLRYDVRRTPRGVTYAAFRVHSADGRETAMTAIVEHAVCRLTAHRIAAAKAASPDPLETVRVGARLPLGAAYRSPDDGALELSVGFWLGEAAEQRPAVSHVLGAMITYTAAAAASLVGAPIPARPAMPHRAAGPAALRARLESLGHAVRQDGDLMRFTVNVTPTAACEIALTEAADGWVEGFGRVLPPIVAAPDAAVAATLQRLQRWTTAGRFVLEGEPPAVQPQVQTPILADPVEAAVWSASQLAAMVLAAGQHLRSGGS